jgi:hypothetical protein
MKELSARGADKAEREAGDKDELVGPSCHLIRRLLQRALIFPSLLLFSFSLHLPQHVRTHTRQH